MQNAHDDLNAAGIPIESVSEDGITRSFYIRDPDNHRVELFCDRDDGGIAAMRNADLNPVSLDLSAAGVRQH